MGIGMCVVHNIYYYCTFYTKYDRQFFSYENKYNLYKIYCKYFRVVIFKIRLK